MKPTIILTVSFFLLCAAADVMANDPDITVREIESDHFELTYTISGSEDITKAQDHLKEYSSSLCQDESVSLGKYNFVKHEAVSGDADKNSLTLIQEIHCGEKELSQALDECAFDVSKVKPYKPAEGEINNLIAKIKTLNELRRKEQYDEAYHLLHPALQKSVNQSDWIALQKKIVTKNAKPSQATVSSWLTVPKSSGGNDIFSGVIIHTLTEKNIMVEERLLYKRQENDFLICFQNADINFGSKSQTK